MKIRILRGDFNSYIRKGGSWDNANPDPLSFEVEVAALPTKGSPVVYTIEGAQLIGLVQETVLVGESSIYVFIPSSTSV
jgi:hypothetical protein